MSKAFPSVWKNKDTNSEPWSEVTCNGTLCFEKTWSTNNWASMGAVIVSTVGTNIDCLVSQSTMTRMVSYPEDGGNFSVPGGVGCNPRFLFSAVPVTACQRKNNFPPLFVVL